MEVKITLENIDNVEKVEIENSDDDSEVWITLTDDGRQMVAQVSIEELKHALRKITYK